MLQCPGNYPYTRIEQDEGEPLLRPNSATPKISNGSELDWSEGKYVASISYMRDSTRTQEHIGNQRIRFRHPFKIAGMVHVLSKPFTLRFENKDQNSKRGLTTSMNTPYQHPPLIIRTCMALKLSDDGASAELIIHMVQSVQAVLIYLSKIKIIEVTRMASGDLVAIEKLWFEFDHATLKNILDESKTYRRTGIGLVDGSHRPYNLTCKLSKRETYIERAGLVPCNALLGCHNPETSVAKIPQGMDPSVLRRRAVDVSIHRYTLVSSIRLLSPSKSSVR